MVAVRPGSRSRAWRAAHRAWLVAVGLVVTLCACRSLAANEREKAGTIERWRDVRIDGLPATQYALSCSGIVLIGADGCVRAPSIPVLGVIPTLGGIKLESGRGSACVAVDPRGYWLTAAHCVLVPPLLLVTTDGNEIRAGQARIVWTGWADGEGSGPDLAILHAEIRPFRCAPPPARVSVGDEVLCTGSGLLSDRFAAGRVLTILTLRNETRVYEIDHDAPLSFGDSGGPALSREGALVGVDVRTQTRPLGLGSPLSTAICPRPEFVRAVIERDLDVRPAPR